MRDNLGGEAFKVGGPVHLHTLHIPKATTGHWYFLQRITLYIVFKPRYTM